MVSFVEQATLRLNSRATETRLRAVNRLLLEMDRNAKRLATTLRRLPNMQNALGFRTTGANNAINDLRRLTAEIERVRRATSRPLGFTVREGSLSRIPTVLRQSVSQTDRLRTGVRNVGREFDRVNNKATYFQRTMARALRTPGYALGGEMYAAARNTVREGVRAPLNLDDARARVRAAGLEPDLAAQIEQGALALSRQYKGVSQADLLSVSVEAAGTTKDLTTIMALMEQIAQYSVIYGAAMGDAREGANSARLAFKAAQIQGADGNPEMAAQLMRVQAQAFIATGYDVLPLEMVNTLRQAGALRYGMSDQALLELLLSRDTGGRMDTAEYRMGFQELLRGTLSAEKRQLQVNAGLRDPVTGRTIVGDQFARSPLEFVENIVVPFLARQGIQSNDDSPENLVLVQDAIENSMGFNTAAARVLTGLVLQQDQTRRELERAMEANPQSFLENPTVRMQMTEVQQQFNNVAAQALEGLLPTIGTGLDALSTSLSNMAAGHAGIKDYAAVAAGIAPMGLAAGLSALADESTRPLGAAGLALSASALQLSGAAAALTGAAGVQAGGSMLGKGKGLLGWGARAAAGVGAVWGATALLGGGARADGETTMADLPGPPAFLSDMLAWTRNTIDGLNEASDESARTWERSSDMVVANVADTMVMRAPEWGEAMANSVENRMSVAGDALAEKIRGALRTPVQVAGGIAAAVAGLDTGSMSVGD